MPQISSNLNDTDSDTEELQTPQDGPEGDEDYEDDEDEDVDEEDDDEEEDDEDLIADLLFDIMDLMGIEAEIEFEEREDHIRYHIEGPELGVLIGRHGQTLEALQFLVGVINARRNLVDYRVVIDVEGYRERREKQLRELARRSAQKAAREGRRVVLSPMPPGDRRVIHLTLASNTSVKTYSEGDEPERCVVIAPGEVD